MEYDLPMVQFQQHGGSVRFGNIALQPGDRLALQCEPTNPHDPQAIAVWQAGVSIGYVSRAAAASLYRQHGSMTSAVLGVCAASYIGKLLKEESSQGHCLIDDRDDAEVLQSLRSYRAGLGVVHVDPIGVVEEHLVVLRQILCQRPRTLWRLVLGWLVPHGAFRTRMPPVQAFARPQSCQDRDQERFMEQAFQNIALTKIELGLCPQGLALECRSRAESFPVSRGTSVLLLTFDRKSEQLRNRILGSPPARIHAERGEELMPAWGNGAICLVQGVTDPDIPGLLGRIGGSHVILLEQDEASVLAAVEPLPVRYKRLKPNEARRTLPDKDAMFNVSSDGTSAAAVAFSSSAGASLDNDSMTDIRCFATPVRTFWDLQLATSADSDAATVATWP